jgi:hypothetical protein
MRRVFATPHGHGRDIGIAQAERRELALGRADRRLEVPEVRRLGRNLGGTDDLPR